MTFPICHINFAFPTFAGVMCNTASLISSFHHVFKTLFNFSDVPIPSNFTQSVEHNTSSFEVNNQVFLIIYSLLLPLYVSLLLLFHTSRFMTFFLTFKNV